MFINNIITKRYIALNKIHEINTVTLRSASLVSWGLDWFINIPIIDERTNDFIRT